MILEDNSAKIWLRENSKYFAAHELMCKCGCGKLKIDTTHVLKLNILREKIDKPLVITSYYRCPDHNTAVKGSILSRHLISDAADIFTSDIDFQNEVLTISKGLFTGIIVYHRKSDNVRWIHLDSRSVPYFEDKRS